MHSNKSGEEIFLSDFIRKSEDAAIYLYKMLIKKSNQFSTQYIIQKAIKDYKKHINNLKPVINNSYTDVRLKPKFSFEPNNFLKGFEGDSDLSLINFVEALKFSTTILKNQILFYKNLAKSVKDQSALDIIHQILQIKEEYLQNLTEEYYRLRYKESN